MSTFDHRDIFAIEGAVADLVAKTNRPRGYPLSKVTIYSVEPTIRHFMPYFNHLPASSLDSMKKLDFKKAGQMFPTKVKEWAKDLSLVPNEFITVAKLIPVTDESNRKTTSCRKYMVEVETDDQDERWLAIRFRKAIKEYVTETLNLHITHPIFGDKYPEPNREDLCARVIVILGNCSERLYQSLEIHGKKEFGDLPIRLRIPDRQFICRNLGQHSLRFDEETVRFDVRLA